MVAYSAHLEWCRCEERGQHECMTTYKAGHQRGVCCKHVLVTWCDLDQGRAVPRVQVLSKCTYICSHCAPQDLITAFNSAPLTASISALLIVAMSGLRFGDT